MWLRAHMKTSRPDRAFSLIHVEDEQPLISMDKHPGIIYKMKNGENTYKTFKRTERRGAGKRKKWKGLQQKLIKTTLSASGSNSVWTHYGFMTRLELFPEE